MKLDLADEPVKDGRSARWESHRQSRRDQLITESRRIIHRLGPDTSMDDIAQAAGTSKPVFYRYFGDKAGLRTAVSGLVVADIQATLSDVLARAHGTREALTAMVGAYLSMAESSPNVYAFVTRSGRDGGIDEFSGFFSAVAGMLIGTLPTRFTTAGEGSALTDAWAFSAIGMVRFSGEWWMSASRTTAPGREDMARRIATWLWSGIENELAAGGNDPAVYEPAARSSQ